MKNFKLKVWHSIVGELAIVLVIAFGFTRFAEAVDIPVNSEWAGYIVACIGILHVARSHWVNYQKEKLKTKATK